MKAHSYAILPQDRLFLRDARPMSGSDVGLGAHWPRPDHVWHAFIHAFHNVWPVTQTWEHRHNLNKDDKNKESSCRFGALQTVGPFPRKGGTIFFPCPLDVSCDTSGTLHPMWLTEGGGTNLPRPLKRSFTSACLGKQPSPMWISRADYIKYLNGETFKPETAELFDSERDIGIAIDADTNSAKDGCLYQAEYLRLRTDVSFAVEASCTIIGSQREEVDVLEKFGKADKLVMGGQQGVMHLTRVKDPIVFPATKQPVAAGRCLLRWTLLAPAVFPGINGHPGGWLPSWVESETGRVMLPRESVERLAGEARDVWRQRVKNAPGFAARLVAARIGPAQAFSGWDLQTGPKQTRLAVPAGSCYVFECSDASEYDALKQSLAPTKRRSALFGEKGFGVGVCSTITI